MAGMYFMLGVVFNGRLAVCLQYFSGAVIGRNWYSINMSVYCLPSRSLSYGTEHCTDSGADNARHSELHGRRKTLPTLNKNVTGDDRSYLQALFETER